MSHEIHEEDDVATEAITPSKGRRMTAQQIRPGDEFVADLRCLVRATAVERDETVKPPRFTITVEVVAQPDKRLRCGRYSSFNIRPDQVERLNNEENAR